MEITLHLEQNEPQPHGLRLVTPLHDFEQRVRVFSSPDGKSWQPIGEETVIFDYSQFMDVSSDTVAFPTGSDRYFRIVIDNVTQELESQLKELTRRLRGNEETRRDERIVIERRPFPHRSHRILARGRPVASDRRSKSCLPGGWVPIGEQSPPLSSRSSTVESRREPLTSFKLATSSHNFSRHARVEVEETHGVETTWRTIGDANLSQLAFRSLQAKTLTISFPESRHSQYRVVIDNRGSSPLVVTGVEAEGNEYQVVVLGPCPTAIVGAGVYASETAAAPDFDTAAITASLNAGYQPTPVALGKQVETPGGGEPAAFSLSQIANNPLLLGGVAVLLVAALRVGAVSAGGRLDSLSQDDR